LLKRADALEQVTYATDIIFDKTGTLTRGEFSISRRVLEEHVLRIDSEFTHKYAVDDYVLALANALESRSEHPIAKAFNDINTEYKFALQDYTVAIGRGISANVNRVPCLIGSKKFVLNITQQTDNVKWAGANVLMAIDGDVVAAFWVTDTIKDDVAQVLSELQEYELSILSGDDQGNVEAIAKTLGIQTAMGGCPPEAKLEYISAQQALKKSIIMLGDGINDAPVLAAADVSVAVGNASDLAKNAADIVLLNPKLTSLSELVNMAHRTKRKIKQNIAWALGYNLSVLPFAVSGVLTPWQAALGMSLSSIIVVYNSTRLMR
jgi:Cu2+-exporting ATPase